jgi:hypothetical protein
MVKITQVALFYLLFMFVILFLSFAGACFMFGLGAVEFVLK